MRIHHGKHHQAYVTNLNAALEKAPELAGRSLEELLGNLNAVPEAIRSAVRNNGGGHWNHTRFWCWMAPNGGGEPGSELGAAINATFGSFTAFREQFQAAGMGRFGSGWAWLVKTATSRLAVRGLPNQDSPLLNGELPIVGLDVWEHAYYLKFQNRRGDYAKTFWNVLNWDVAAAEWQSARA
jgi:Fe-Mn family superoxide dismutase